jgi:23S rRNA G2445 N2-methylase RlmL
MWEAVAPRCGVETVTIEATQVAEVLIPGKNPSAKY